MPASFADPPMRQTGIGWGKWSREEIIPRPAAPRWGQWVHDNSWQDQAFPQGDPAPRWGQWVNDDAGRSTGIGSSLEQTSWSTGIGSSIGSSLERPLSSIVARRKVCGPPIPPSRPQSAGSMCSRSAAPSRPQSAGSFRSQSSAGAQAVEDRMLGRLFESEQRMIETRERVKRQNALRQLAHSSSEAAGSGSTVEHHDPADAPRPTPPSRPQSAGIMRPRSVGMTRPQSAGVFRPAVTFDTLGHRSTMDEPKEPESAQPPTAWAGETSWSGCAITTVCDRDNALLLRDSPREDAHGHDVLAQREIRPSSPISHIADPVDRTPISHIVRSIGRTDEARWGTHRCIDGTDGGLGSSSLAAPHEPPAQSFAPSTNRSDFVDEEARALELRSRIRNIAKRRPQSASGVRGA